MSLFHLGVEKNGPKYIHILEGGRLLEASVLQ